jgi:hypothetical protein
VTIVSTAIPIIGGSLHWTTPPVVPYRPVDNDSENSAFVVVFVVVVIVADQPNRLIVLSIYVTKKSALGKKYKL